MGEAGLLRALLGTYPAASPEMPGDDCAVVGVPGSGFDLLLKADSVAEGVHFEAGGKPECAGRKALCRALSDLAAMGGRPS
ncbi:MAG: AIR synthase related protein, partial [Terrimicrobiaceae bacterium]|nr:AIR synthase related protein [Terrimicrobiaceae bacterium]